MRTHSWRPPWLLPVIVGVLAVLPFWPTLHASFLSDDWFFVEVYHRAQPSFGWFVWRAISALELVPTNFYRPLPFITLAAQIRVAGLDAVGLHASNLMLHGATTALLFALLRRWPGSRTTPALVAALLFAWFPRRVEAVAWLSCRPDLLATLLAVASVWLFDVTLRNRSRWASGAAVVTWALALMSKESVAALPMVHVALAWHHACAGQPGSASFGSLRLALRRAAPFLLAVPALLVVRRVAIGAWVGGYGASVLGVSASTFLAAPKHVVYQLIPPVEALEGLMLSTLGAPVASLLWAMGLAAGVSVLWSVRRQPAVTVGVVWLLAGILPVVTLPLSLSTPFNDRLLYLPGIGMAALLFAGLSRLSPRLLLGCGLVACSMAVFLTVPLSMRWARAGELSDRTLAALEEIARADRSAHIYVAAVPDSLGGAYMLRNGIGYALAVHDVPNPMRIVPLSSYFVPLGDVARAPVRVSLERGTSVMVESLGPTPQVMTGWGDFGDLAHHEPIGAADRFGRFTSVRVTLREPGPVVLLTPGGASLVRPSP